MTEEQTKPVTPADTWQEVIVLLREAADRGYRQTATDLAGGDRADSPTTSGPAGRRRPRGVHRRA